MPHYEITARFVCHDVRYVATAQVIVERDTPPTQPEAEKLVWPRIDAMVTAHGGEECPVDITQVGIREVPTLSAISNA